MRASDTCTGLRPGQYLTHVHRHITRHKVAMDSCFTLIRAHLHNTAVRPLYVQWPNKGKTGVYDYQSSQVVWLVCMRPGPWVGVLVSLALVALTWEINKLFWLGLNRLFFISNVAEMVSH